MPTQSFCCAPSSRTMADRWGSPILPEFSARTCTSMSGLAFLASQATAGNTKNWCESKPVSPTDPRPRPMVENCWQGEPPTMRRTPPGGTASRT
eukprot:4421754-Alexandrium_andersonii.AAC.1